MNMLDCFGPGRIRSLFELNNTTYFHGLKNGFHWLTEKDLIVRTTPELASSSPTSNPGNSKIIIQEDYIFVDAPKTNVQ
jgi:hypothetical protein